MRGTWPSPGSTAWGFWIFLFGAILFYFSYIGSEGLYGSGSAPDVGWFAYSPLAGKAFSRGNATDYWILGILVSGFGSLAGAVNMAATTLTMRCKGMTLSKMPLLVWLMLIVSLMILVALPPLTAAQVMLLFDRFLGAHFFDTQAGGDAVLWQHFFWFFGHPEVYILMIPGFAYASEIIPVFSRKVIFGYPIMVAATCAIGVVSLGVWAHHMLVVGMSKPLNIWFAVVTMVVGIPTGIKIFNWVGTMFGGKIHLKVPMLFCIAFLFQFTVAGLTGIMLAAAPFNWQLSDSYFVVAHFHYVLIGGLVFTIFGALHYWFPKMSGKMMNETLGRCHFWFFLIGFQLTFTTMHVQGLPRHASADLHLSRRSRLGDLEPAHDRGGRLPDHRRTLLRRRRAPRPLAGPGRGAGPLERVDPGVVDQLAAARLQLRGRARGEEPPTRSGI